jgi:hypothetical protein
MPGIRRGERAPTLDLDAGGDRGPDGTNAQGSQEAHRPAPRYRSHYVGHHFLRILID